MAHLLSCLVVLAVSGLALGEGTPSTDTEVWNRIADVVVDYICEDQTRRGNQIRPLPDVSLALNEKIGFVRLRGEFNFTGGWLGDVTTARRVGDVISGQQGKKLQLTVRVSWDTLKSGYKYLMRIGWTRRGSLEVEARRNLVRAVFGFEVVDDECKTTFDDFEILEMEDIQVDITGLGFINFLAEQIGKWFLQQRKNRIWEEVEKAIKESIPQHLEDFYCDQYIALLDTSL